jgi:hypothetical protein
MPRDLKGWARLRPFRVAFLIEDGEYANLALDGIFADSYNRWGGRFSLIAPCINGRIAPNYWPWLEAYDPDIVYSHVPLSRLTFWRCTSGFLPPNTPSTSWTANRGSTCSASNRPTDLRHFRGLGRLTTWIANSLVCNVCVCLSRLRIEAGWSFR